MYNPKISIICAIAENRAIGKNNQLLWHIKEDFKFFKEKTSGHVIVMGQKTFESIGKPLPNRTTIVLSNDPECNIEGVIMARTFDEVFAKAREIEKEEIFICGGGSVYAQTIGMADKLYLTVIEGNFEADVFFPEYDEFKKIISKREGSEGDFKYKFLELEK
ncbi:MAG: dihydrofolate reductase [Candidatus Moranbacteria bacterium GW2011_GWD2_36_12]|nr:MAG: dihydrofolate reductase [Candidatus Moranbacteria bacterium GW2011_GWD2_36_12]KKQ07072.1 MAG: dihydrofolate reductase [Candidatus Moranbacteria bacterium GW2011_GWE2_36_40]